MKSRLVILLALSICTARAVEIRRDRFDFSVPLPAGYEDVSAIPALKDELVAVGVWNPNRDGLVRLFSISGFSGALGREDMAKFIPKQPNITSEKMRWKDLEIDSFRIAEETGGQSWITINVLVPTIPRAIQVRVFGPAAEEKAMRTVLASTLANLDAKTNWLSTEERWKKGVYGIAGMAITGLLVVWIVRKAKKKKSPANQTAEPTPL